MPARVSFFARALEPLVAGLGILFVLVSVLVAAIWTFGLGEQSVEATVSNSDLRATLVWLLGRIDLIWLTLAAANTYLILVANVGLPTARRWALLILGSVLAIAWLSTHTGLPLGGIRYGTALGLKVGPVPLGLPLLWFSIIIGARAAVLRFRPRLHQGALAAGVGILALLTDLNLEPLAAKWRGFWFWHADSPTLPPVFDPPFTGSIAWGVLAAVLALTFREPVVAGPAATAFVRPATINSQPSTFRQPILTLAIFHAVFLASHVAHSLSH